MCITCISMGIGVRILIKILDNFIFWGYFDLLLRFWFLLLIFAWGGTFLCRIILVATIRLRVIILRVRIIICRWRMRWIHNRMVRYVQKIGIVSQRLELFRVLYLFCWIASHCSFSGKYFFACLGYFRMWDWRNHVLFIQLRL